MTDWQQQFRLRETLTQADFEALELALSRQPVPANMQRARVGTLWSGAILRAAIEAGWIAEPDTSVMRDEQTGKRVWMYAGRNVDDMHPAAVQWLGAQVDARYNEILSAVPKAL